jgi:argininosuccinate lyase
MIAAVDIADMLVRDGIPFREAHAIVANLVRVALADGRSLSAFSDSELAALAPTLDGEALVALLQDRSWLESKVSPGGTALVRLREQLAAARAALA